MSQYRTVAEILKEAPSLNVAALKSHQDSRAKIWYHFYFQGQHAPAVDRCQNLPRRSNFSSEKLRPHQL
ncbi:MAG: hypothetical protein A3A73_03135 [Omnitrophica bacterium RIFCSPLOWO2_01_FULL_50_24]|nr:MAG: hypothetical protein A3A73_03135 [Omnitrophica bacterium RIFCSPLOWO2_01_FULL_50_24]